MPPSSFIILIKVYAKRYTAHERMSTKNQPEWAPLFEVAQSLKGY
jgi:hypothetical protein